MKEKKLPMKSNEQKTADPAERAERVQKLLSGRVKSDDPVVAYMVDRVRVVIQEAEQLSNRLQQSEAQTTQIRNRLIELRGIRAKYLEDLEVFDKPSTEAIAAKPIEAESKPESEATPSEDAA